MRPPSWCRRRSSAVILVLEEWEGLDSRTVDWDWSLETFGLAHVSLLLILFSEFRVSYSEELIKDTLATSSSFLYETSVHKPGSFCPFGFYDRSCLAT